MVQYLFLYCLFYLLSLSLGGAVQARKKEKDFKNRIKNICVLEQSLALPGSLIICHIRRTTFILNFNFFFSSKLNILIFLVSMSLSFFLEEDNASGILNMY